MDVEKVSGVASPNWISIACFKIINFICMNAVSARTKNQNLLKAKTKSFKDNLKESENLLRAKSSSHNLASQLYSNKTNMDFSPKKASGDSRVSRNASTGKLPAQKSLLNPEMIISTTVNTAMNGLTMRASHVSSFAEMNTALLKQKKQLQMRIAALREGIAQQKKKLSNAEYNCKKNRNGVDLNTSMYNQAHLKSQKLNQNINDTEHDNSNLRRDLNNLRKKIDERKDDIKRETKWVEELENQKNNLKHNLMQEQKMRTITKADLTKSQRTMNSASIYCKQLENQKAVLLLEINQSVSTNKL